MAPTATPLYNSRTIDTFLRLVRGRYPFVDIEELLRRAGINGFEVNDQGHWFTQEEVDRFMEKLVEMTGNRNIAREAGRYAASPEASGAMRMFALALLGPGRVFELIRKVSANFTRSARYESRMLGPHSVEVVVTPFAGIEEKSYQCENRMGVFEAIPLIFSNDVPRIEHTECLFKGGKCCRYVISWKAPASFVTQRLRNYLAAFLLGAFLVALPSLSLPVLAGAAALGAIGLLLLTLLIERQDKKGLYASLNQLRDSSQQLVEQINVNYNNAQLANEIGQALSRQVTSEEEVLQGIVEIMSHRLDFDRGLILLADKTGSRLEFRAGYGYSGEERDYLEKSSFRLDNPGSKGVFVRAFREQKPLFIDDIRPLLDDFSPRSQALVRKMNTRAFICCPITHEGESMGILAVDNVSAKRPLRQSDLTLLRGITPVVAISLHNAKQLQRRERQLTSMLEVLAATIDARDPLTAGHSSRVTGLAVGIAEEMGLDEAMREMIRVAALLHDYGKVGVPDAILKKEGRLSKAEYEIVKTHSGKTREILERINFEGVFRKVPEVAGAHHEKFDGSGYPRGLKGKDIPLGARIIAVADFYEALTATRHYRGPVPHGDVVTMICEESGRAFDPKVVDAFLRHARHAGLDEAAGASVHPLKPRVYALVP